MVGILVSFWEGLFSGSMLVSGRVTSYNYMSRCTVLHRSVILLQPEFLMKRVSRVWFWVSILYGKVQVHGCISVPKIWARATHLCIYTSSPQKQSQNPQEVRNHHILGRSLFFITAVRMMGLRTIWLLSWFNFNCYGIYTPNVAPGKDHFKTQKHVIHLSGDRSVLLEGFTTLRDLTCFFEVRIYFLWGTFPAHCSSLWIANFFLLFWSLNWGFSKKGQFLGSLGLIWEQNLRRRFLGLKDPGGFVKIAGFYLTFTFVVWKSDFFGIRPSWKVIPEKMGLRTSFFLTHQVGEDQTREMYGNFWDSLHNSALFGLVI